MFINFRESIDFTPFIKPKVSIVDFKQITISDINSTVNFQDTQKKEQSLNVNNDLILNNVTSIPTATEQRSNLNKDVHTIFDPILIESGNSCSKTGARSIVDVPPIVHYPTIGRFLL